MPLVLHLDSICCIMKMMSEELTCLGGGLVAGHLGS